MFAKIFAVFAIVACVFAATANAEPKPEPQYYYSSNYAYPAALSYSNYVRASPYAYSRFGYPYGYNTYPYNSYAYVA